LDVALYSRDVQETPGWKSWLLVVLVIVAALAAAAAAALLLGDQSESNPRFDRAVQPIEISATAAYVLGTASLVVVAGSVVLVVWRIRSRASAAAWTVAVLSFVCAGGLVGVAYAEGTAQVTGANIGYGLVMLVAIPGVPAALLFGIIAMARGWHKDRQPTPLPSI
jgi:uncharacterized membrane protein YdcZ (DUF606 family)